MYIALYSLTCVQTQTLVRARALNATLSMYGMRLRVPTRIELGVYTLRTCVFYMR